ncbi:MAG: alternative ribosome rescue aminoacyl-tRNA hydrolase ArfB [Dermatophilus congolensis]|nr:alternative ribosome rescue aminoacyl-tRNA hydrolase ArfB [Dermatophilus congolensis]
MVVASDLSERFSKASGPGGQGVNTTDSRVELVLDVTAARSFTPKQRARVVAALGEVVTIVAAENRAQYRNRVAARDRLAARLREALAPDPPKRRATKPTRGSQARRLRGKRQRGDTKRMRGRVTGEE